VTIDAAPLTAPPARSLSRSLVLAVLGGLSYGAWAAYANAEHGVDAAVRAGVTQGALSFATTFGITVVGDSALRWFRRGAAQLAAVIVTTPAMMGAALTTIHTWSGTPDVVETILPSVIGGTVFATMYVGARRARVGRSRLR
jgi:hypothetical protein